jgi:hypothetical protein
LDIVISSSLEQANFSLALIAATSSLTRLKTSSERVGIGAIVSRKREGVNILIHFLIFSERQAPLFEPLLLSDFHKYSATTAPTAAPGIGGEKIAFLGNMTVSLFHAQVAGHEN